MSNRPTACEIAAIEAALAVFGRDATVHDDGRVHAQLAHCRPVFYNPEVSLRALPLANRLHRKMTGRNSGFCQELFKRAADVAGVPSAEAEMLFDRLGEAGHENPFAVSDAKRRAKLCRLDARFYREPSQ